MIEGYAYALRLNGHDYKAWITGKDGALRDVNLERFVHNFEAEHGVAVSTAQVIDQRIDRVMMHYPATQTFFA
jgi:transcriptional regulator of acetoin/glycerol metabolism